MLTGIAGTLPANIHICSSVLQVPFLNLMANIRDRAGAIHIRVGGNTQETATLVDSLPNNELLQKELSDLDNPVRSCFIIITRGKSRLTII